MAREYDHRRSSRSRRGAPHQFLVITVTFLLGYLTGSFFDLEKITRWVNAQMLIDHDMKTKQNKLEEQHAAVLPKPKFEFYTLLTNEKPSRSQPSTNAAVTTQRDLASNKNGVASPGSAIKVTIPAETTTSAIKPNPEVQQPTAAAAGKENYLVQVASFKTRQDAEQMKGSLILKGFSVYIIPVNHATKGNWFRVVVGPYANRVYAQQAQVTLARNEHLKGMIIASG